MSITEKAEDAYYALRQYLTDDTGSLVNPTNIVLGITIPTLLLSGHLALSEMNKAEEPPLLPDDHQQYVTMFDATPGSATHAHVTFSFPNHPDTGELVSRAMMRWTEETNILSVGSVEQCVADAEEFIEQRLRPAEGKPQTASLDCMKGDEVVSQFTCVAVQSQTASEILPLTTTTEATCFTNGVMVMNEQDSDAPDIG